MDAIRYMDTVAEHGSARAYKARLLDALSVRRWHTVLDVGCGPGTDLLDLAATGAEWVIGVDADPLMVAEARRRTEDYPAVAVHLGDARALPVADGMIDRARVDRVLHHVAEPAAVFAELRRVVRADGVVVVAQPDWDTITVDPGDVRVNRAVREFVCDHVVRNATVGRRVARLAEEAGFDAELQVTAPVFRDFTATDEILGFSRNVERAVRAGRLDCERAGQWLAELRTGRFLATVMLFTAVLRPGTR
ncbi:ubiquinone/menaquinone biosynthesis C-methylase UbiE [Saccharothrix tamanrassetensis]|uniref:Ubiquinone/menaquinone biosynthesis C-methylase UbiE n=1 Tax=Saccharothrix tamanrassetensis TaxID=1051531 RepID=A0A841CHG0_9PSEU|nr:methyltransferase domain-containing protein [Saccharothrix tamanrassetensis]MBB5956739.1 ubiquinone/menaquinone biosynthesis C-methylase UbiE [Saccharothrix tamanrassetensis]